MRQLFFAIAVVVGVCSACGDDDSGGSGSSGAAGSGGASGSGNSSGVGGGGGSAGSSGGAAGTTGGSGGSVGGNAGSGGVGGGADAALTERRVFVSSTTLPGNFGGIAVGDAECQKLANQAGLGGAWRAWVSDGMSQGPSTTFVQSTVPYVLVGGGQIAADWTDLTDLTIALPIDRDESGSQVAESLVWTGVSPVGTCCPPSCNGFTTPSGEGMAGTTTGTQPWSTGTFASCSESHRLYCFEQ